MNIFDLDFDRNESELVLLPVPWEVTTSYGKGCAMGPESILAASAQVDLFDPIFGRFYEKGIYFEAISEEILSLNESTSSKADLYLQSLGTGQANSSLLTEVNDASKKINQIVFDQAMRILKEEKTLGTIGGDHSCPLGAIQALEAVRGNDFGILHIDAHADLRNSYQGFQHSHASIIRNIHNDVNPSKIVQVGIRDFCDEEWDFIQGNEETIKTFYDRDLKTRLFDGEIWGDIADEIIDELPKDVYISFDIDGLDPSLCPNTGTPVPGGLNFNEMLCLFSKLVEHDKKIIGFDLCEVSPGENDLKGSPSWDANIGARVLFQLCGLILSTQES